MINITFDLRDPEELFSIYILLKNLEKDLPEDSECFSDNVEFKDSMYTFTFSYQYGVLEECRVYRRERESEDNE